MKIVQRKEEESKGRKMVGKKKRNVKGEQKSMVTNIHVPGEDFRTSPWS
jgi:hypothetical protein